MQPVAVIRATLGFALASLATAAPAAAIVAPPERERPPLDVREQATLPAPLPQTAAQVRGREALSDKLGSRGVLEFAPSTNSARVVAKLDGFLTGPSGRDAADVALDYVRANEATFGLSGAEVGALRLVRRYTDNGGTTHLVWAQRLDGIVAWGNELLANVTKDGRLINVSGSPVPDLGTRTTEPDLTARQAVDRALDDAGASFSVPRGDDQGTADSLTEFPGGHSARLVLFTERPGDTHLAWQVTAAADDDEVYEYVIDARDGRLLFRLNNVNHVAATLSAWEYAPDLHITAGSGPARAGEQQTKTTLFGGDPIQVNDGSALRGPYGHVYPDLDDNNEVDAEVPASSGTTWSYPLQRFSGGSTCPPTSTTAAGQFTCVWGGETSPQPSPSYTVNLRQNAAQVYYYVNNFHDWLAKEPNIGFTAASGNFETAGGDAVEAEVLDGATKFDAEHRNNANMLTLSDGSPPKMQMYLFRGSGGKPHGNGGDDATVIYHEYTHGLSNRLVTGGTGGSTLRTHQSRSMGEGWGDWYAMDLLESQGLDETDTVAAQGQMNVGFYLNGGDLDELRTEALDCPVTNSPGPACPGTPGAGSGGYTYGDMGKLKGQPEVHDDGEIWAQAIWDLRQQVGAATARRLVTDGMRLSAPSPSFLDMRNGILQADQVAFGGANRNTIWTVFAARGMGASASTTSGNDTAPVEAFDTPGAGVTVSGRVVDQATGAGIANAYVHLDAGAAPGDFATRTDANGNYSLTGVPSTTFARGAATAPGYSHVERAGVAAGGGVDFQLQRNYAAKAGGAAITAFNGPDLTEQGCGPGGLIDGDLGAGWISTVPNAQGEGAGGNKTVTIQLSQAVDISGVVIDPASTCGDGASASLGQYSVETSADGTNFAPLASGAFAEGNNGKLNPVPGTAANARFVRLTMLSSQRQTGANDFPGGVKGATFMDVAEIEVYGRAPAPPAPPPPPPVADKRAPRPSLALVRRQKLKVALAKGLKLRVKCDEPCAWKVSATIDAKTAKKLKLIKKKSRAKSFKVGAASLKLGTGTRTATLKFTRKSKPKLKKLKSVKLSLVATVTDAAGNRAKKTFKVTVKR
jgi:hypothetical protein